MTPIMRGLLRWAARRPIAFGAVGGLVFSVLMAGAFAPVGLWGLVFVAAAPLVIVGECVGSLRSSKPLKASLGAWIGVAPWWAYAMVWTARNTQAGYPPLILVLSFYAALFVWLAARSRRRWSSVPAVVLTPLLWAGVEVVRGEWLLDGYPWYLVAHPLIDAPTWVLTWPAAIAGTYVVGVLTMLPVAASIDALAGRRKSAFMALGVVGLWAGLGAIGVLRPEPDGNVRVALVQTNVPQDVRGSWSPTDRWAQWERIEALTLAAETSDPDFIVWPETMFPGVAFQDEAVQAERDASLAWFIESPGGSTPVPAWEVRERVLDLQQRVGVPVVVGAASFEGFAILEDDRGLRYDWDVRRNSAFLVNGGTVQPDPYSKLRLVPFGEVMPYISAWPWLEQQLLAIGASGMSFDLATGDRPVTLKIPGTNPVEVATPICFESTVAGVVREVVYGAGPERADVIVVLTNDGWFGDWDPGRIHHLQASRWRSVELGVSMARSANTGVSAIVDAEGSVLHAGVDGQPGSARIEGVLAGDVPMYRGQTPFGATVGMWPARAIGAFAVLAAILPVRARRKTS
ncbi:MAG: apolipoprotein N-acyltransferase [Planctomycetota bacterium]